jgi:integrase
MSERYQGGYLRCVKRKNGSRCWEFLWRESGPLGTQKRRTMRVGSVEQFPTRELAANAVSGLRMCINAERCRRQQAPIQMSDLIDHYILTELSPTASWHSHATRIVYREFLELWIRPSWSTTDIRDVRTVAVEHWLSQLRRQNKEPLCSSTKAKIRSLMSVLFNHAIRYEWLEQSKNPITFVRQSAERLRTPEVLEASEVERLLSRLQTPYRLMVLLAVTTGLRRSELFALKWGDIEFSSLTLHIRRSIYLRTVGKCKTATSKKNLPLSHYVVSTLESWLQKSKYQEVDDWVFSSPRSHGRYPYWPAMLLTRTIRPAAVRAGIEKRVTWHTFRHTYSTMLVANGENVKVIQELMRHASSRSTLEIYSQARPADKRAAQQRIMQMIFPEDLNRHDPTGDADSEYPNVAFDWIN